MRMTAKIIDEWIIGKYNVLTYDEKPEKDYYKVSIKGRIYNLVPVYDYGENNVAIESNESFLGDEITFIRRSEVGV